MGQGLRDRAVPPYPGPPGRCPLSSSQDICPLGCSVSCRDQGQGIAAAKAPVWAPG